MLAYNKYKGGLVTPALAHLYSARVLGLPILPDAASKVVTSDVAQLAEEELPLAEIQEEPQEETPEASQELAPIAITV